VPSVFPSCSCLAILLNVDAIGEVWANVERMADARVLNAKMVYPSMEDAAPVSSGFDLAGPLRPGAPIIAMELQGEEPSSKLDKLRSHMIETGELRDGELAIAYPEHVARLKDAFFAVDPSARMASVRTPSNRMEDCTVVMVLPTAVAKGSGGAVLSDLMKALAAGGIALGGRAPKPKPGETHATAPPPPPPGRPGEFGSPLMMTALTVVDMDRRCADEFLEVYRLVVPDFGEMSNEYSAGPAIALEIVGEDAVRRVREICGPRDVDVGKRIR
jgi:Nucleoside diphosphate kinase